MTKRAKMGFLVAPLVAAILLGCWDVFDGRAPADDLVGFVVFGLIAYVYCGMFTLVLAVPGFLLLRRFDLIRWWSTCLTGAAIGLAAASVLGIPSTSQSHNATFLSLIGTAAAVVFWLIVGRGRA
jgi:hypothetical protein